MAITGFIALLSRGWHSSEHNFLCWVILNGPLNLNVLFRLGQVYFLELITFSLLAGPIELLKLALLFSVKEVGLICLAEGTYGRLGRAGPVNGNKIIIRDLG